MSPDSVSNPVPLLLEWHGQTSPPPTANSFALTPAPLLVQRAGLAAQFAWDEFFHGEIRNSHTRRNYQHAVDRLLLWLDGHGLDLSRVTPAHVGRYLDDHPGSAPTKKLHLSAIRAFFDKLVVRHVVLLNPAQSVRGPRHQVFEGRTPEIPPVEVRQLLDSIGTNDAVSLRDRALIATLVYTGARVSAVTQLRDDDLDRDVTTWSFRFGEKGGKVRQIPLRDDLRQMLAAYLGVLARADVSQGDRLFRSARGKTGLLTSRGLSRWDACRMLKRRLRKAGLSLRFSPHSFRATVITDLLQHGASLEDVQYLAGHSDPRTTRLYDRRQRRVTRNLVERITV